MDNAKPLTQTDISSELARERTRQAADRTLMAWIRTSLSLIGFGFGIAGSFPSNLVNLVAGNIKWQF
jgi:uncharacterized membrane protein YidH (DUF202 family)